MPRLLERMIKMENKSFEENLNRLKEIVQNMHQQSGYVYSKAWSDLSDYELYSMLPQYQQGLIDHGIAKIGKSELEKAIKSLYKKEG